MQLKDKLKTDKEIAEAREAQAVALQKQRTGPGAFKRGADIGTDKIAKENRRNFLCVGRTVAHAV